jgi:hypothetical protein
VVKNFSEEHTATVFRQNFSLKMDAVFPSEGMLIVQTTPYHNSEDRNTNLYSHKRPIVLKAFFLDVKLCIPRNG